jgi:hypothetical protein
MRTILAAIVLPLALSACATSVTDRGDAAQAKSDAIYDSCQQDAKSRGIEALDEKTRFFDSTGLNPEMLFSTEFANEQEKEAIVKLWDSWQQCGERFVAFLKSDLNDDIATLWRLDVNRTLLQLADLYNGDVSWGSFNRSLQRYDLEFSQAFSQATSAYWRREYAVEERRQAAIGAALQAYGNALKDYGNAYAGSANRPATVQQMPIYDPVRTSCRENGDRVTCTQTSDLMTSPKIISCRVNGSVMTCTEQ